jgi:hypothetical protein
MIRKPRLSEWNTSQLPHDRRVYLEDSLRFEDIVASIVSEARFLRNRIEPYNAPPRGDPRDARQIIFQIDVGEKACDLLYNAPDGLRGRYWQSPDHGFTATRRLIEALLPALMSSSEDIPPTRFGRSAPMAGADISASLAAPSAKVWPREFDEKGTSLLIEHRLVVPRWEENEQHAPANNGMWRRTPIGGELEIKGAILGPDQMEYVPEAKRDRSCQIHRFGFT